MSRPGLPTIPSAIQGMGSGPWNIISAGQSAQWVGDPKKLWDLGVRSVRIGGTDPYYSNATQAGKDNALQYVAQGFYVELGMTFVNRFGTIAGKFSTDDKAAYLATAVTFAQWCQDNGIGAFMLQNEMSSLIDTTSWTVADFELWVRDELAPACRAVAPTIDLVINETANRIAAWAALGRGSANIKRGFNIYGGSATDLAGFTTQANSIVAMGPDAYVSEWNIYFTWNLGTFDQALQKQYVAERLAVLNGLGIKHYFFTYKRTNTNDAGDWNAFAAAYSIGVPNSPSDIFFNRKLFYALFPERSAVGGGSRKWLNYNGTSAYSQVPITPSGAGILIMFWLNRQEYASSEKYVINNFNPAHGGLQSFRLVHDAPTGPNPNANRDIYLNTFNDTSSGGFSVVNALSGGDDQHIAIYITPQAEGANLYINNRRMPTKPSGYIGAPIDDIVIGARAGDFFGKSKMRIRQLVIRNNPNTDRAVVEQQIADHYNAGWVPAGASYYDFDISPTDDQSANGKNLTNTNTTIYDEAMPGARPASATRSAGGSRVATA